MSTQAVVENLPDTVGFARLRALAARGYRPLFNSDEPAPGFVSFRLEHPRKRNNAPPALTLWSDGTLATSSVLWPQKFVPTEEGPPDWQKYILATDDKGFESFASTIVAPTSIDLILMPALRESKVFAAKLMFGTALCISIAVAIQLLTYLFR